MKSVAALFNRWSLQGLDKQMEKGHGYAVQIMLEELKVKYPFDFLDVGCGNGWVVRQVSKHPLCRSAWGIDVSGVMIKRARKLQNTKQHFLKKDLLKWRTRKRFDVIFSMEALYYIVPLEPAIKKIYDLLKEGGLFLCGVDYYLENKASHSWQEKCDVKMDLRSKKEWIELFRKWGSGMLGRKISGIQLRLAQKSGSRSSELFSRKEPNKDFSNFNFANTN